MIYNNGDIYEGYWLNDKKKIKRMVKELLIIIIMKYMKVILQMIKKKEMEQ